MPGRIFWKRKLLPRACYNKSSAVLMTALLHRGSPEELFCNILHRKKNEAGPAGLWASSDAPSGKVSQKKRKKVFFVMRGS